MNKLIYILIIFVVSVQAQSADLSVSVGLNTWHYYTPSVTQEQIDLCGDCELFEFNEDNNLISIGYNSLEAFTMINSYNVRSFGIMKNFLGDIFHARAGLVSGYKINKYGVLGGKETDIMPFVAGGVHYDFNSYVTVQADVFTNSVISSIKINF